MLLSDEIAKMKKIGVELSEILERIKAENKKEGRKGKMKKRLVMILNGNSMCNVKRVVPGSCEVDIEDGDNGHGWAVIQSKKDFGVWTPIS